MKDEDIKQLLEFKGSTDARLKNIEDGIEDLKNNHLSHIYAKIDCIMSKLSHPKPSWAVLVIITFMSTTIGVLLMSLLRK